MLLWLLLAVSAVLLATGFLSLQLAHRRRKAPDPEKRETFDKGVYRKNGEILYAASQALAAWPSQDLYIQSYDGLRLHGRLLPLEDARGTILMFHGYRSCAQGDFGCAVPFFRQLGYQVFLADQRAHQESQGRYISFGILERLDVLAWARVLALRFGADHDLYLDGISMGAATVLMAADLPLPPNVRGIIADSGFSSPKAIIDHVMKRLHLPSRLLLGLMEPWCRLLGHFSLKKHSAAQALAKSRLPILFVHGKADPLVPWEMTQENYDACRSEKHLLLVEGAAHGESFLLDRPACEAALTEFLMQTRSKREEPNGTTDH